MPLYEYECECGERTTDLRPMADRERPMLCPKCGGEAHNIISSGAVKVWHYEPWRMDAHADARRCGVPD